MKEEEIVSLIEGKRRGDNLCGREVTARILSVLGHPEKGMQIIHIAGTNGKGSTAAALAAVLQEAGFRTGLFTSPHLIDYRERIRVDGKMIPGKVLSRLGEGFFRDKVEERAGVLASMFDISLLIAIMWFREMQCDYVVMETGLGGGRDSTRGLATVPIVSVITRIGMDHMALLGNTIGEIAGEKAGILRPGTRLVLAENDRRAEEVILKRAGDLSVPVLDLGQADPPAFSGIRAEAMALSWSPSGLLGTYQRENLSNAAGASLLLSEADPGPWEEKARKAHLPLSLFMDRVIRQGFLKVRWPGRMEILSEDPFFLVDGALNPQGVRALKTSLLSLYGPGPYILLTGVLKDKAFREMAEVMAPLASWVGTVPVQDLRGLSAEELAGVYRGALSGRQGEDRGTVHIFPSTEEGLWAALKEGKKTGQRIIAFGSLYFVGEVLSVWRERKIRP